MLSIEGGELVELHHLMLAAKRRRLPDKDEDRLRALLARDFPSAEEASRQDLYRIGLFALGIATISHQTSGRSPTASRNI